MQPLQVLIICKNQGISYELVHAVTKWTVISNHNDSDIVHVNIYKRSDSCEILLCYRVILSSM